MQVEDRRYVAAALRIATMIQVARCGTSRMPTDLSTARQQGKHAPPERARCDRHCGDRLMNVPGRWPLPGARAVRAASAGTSRGRERQGAQGQGRPQGPIRGRR